MVATYEPKHHPQITLPLHMFTDRQNSITYDLSDRTDQVHLQAVLEKYKAHQWAAGNDSNIKPRTIVNPADATHKIGHVTDITAAAVDDIVKDLSSHFTQWQYTSLDKRADIIMRIADGLLKHQDELIALCVYEAGKTISDAIGEIREAVDFCRYYAIDARRNLAPVFLPGPAGEQNSLQHEGRGVWACISPWNFPLSIFIGQITAALMTGNCVAAKPAPQTCLIAARALEIMIEAGLPETVMALLPGSGDVGQAVITHPLIAGVAFTGSTQTARAIYQTLAQKNGPIVPLIAETGGQNAMIVDSSALPEQVVDDVIRSGFLSAGQRCSALRVLYLQEEIAPTVLNMLRGALAELIIGNPAEFTTDVGPVIDKAAQQRLLDHLNAADVPLMQSDSMPPKGIFVLPTVLALDKISDLTDEHFGPIIHVVHFSADQKKNIIQNINDYGYGLTLGIHSRIEPFIDEVVQQARVGNIYVNRGITGAVVGVQPFGGMGLSGTGPKAGGPDYLKRFTIEKTVSINLTAIGGNAALANLNDGL